MTEHTAQHSHVFLAPGHEGSEKKTWAVIWLCGFMMIAEIVGGSLFGSVALVADGLHMSTHAGALLIAALAYTYARRHASDSRFSFGTGKLGDLAGFTSAIILAMIALLIGYEAVCRLITPVAIDFSQAIPIAILGLCVNVLSAWLLSGDGHHGHSHGHGHGHGHAEHNQGEHANDAHGHGDEIRSIDSEFGNFRLEVFELGVPPRFRLHAEGTSSLNLIEVIVETTRPDGMRQTFSFARQEHFLESLVEIPEPHEFSALLKITRDGKTETHELSFEETVHMHTKAETHHDNNHRAALVHVIADAAVSVLVICGLMLARLFGWLWIDPVVGMIGAVVIANWAWGLIRDTGGILLDMNADHDMSNAIRTAIEMNGDRMADLHLWRLGPGHLGAIVSIVTDASRGVEFYRTKLSRFSALSHLTVEVRPK